MNDIAPALLYAAVGEAAADSSAAVAPGIAIHAAFKWPASTDCFTLSKVLPLRSTVVKGTLPLLATPRSAVPTSAPSRSRTPILMRQ